MQAEADTSAPAASPMSAGKSLLGVEIEIAVSVGKTRLTLAELMKLENNAVLQLDHKIEDPVDIFVGERLIARGELEETGEDGKLAVRLTEVSDLSGGL